MVYIFDGIIVAISKHIVAKDALTGRYEGVCAEESAELGIVVAGLEVIETGFLVIDIATVAERVMQTKCAGHRAGGGQQSAPSIVGKVPCGVTLTIPRKL